MKFGGTSVRNKEAIERVISIVSNRIRESARGGIGIVQGDKVAL